MRKVSTPIVHIDRTLRALESSVQIVKSSLSASLGSADGLFVQKNTFGTHQGPSGGPEVLALIFADDPVFGYWYGHVLQHPKRRATYVAAIVWTKKLVEAPSVPLLFARFHYWIKDRLEYEPCSTQLNGDVYCEAANLPAAASCLARMIREFELGKRAGSEGTAFESSPVDLRVLDIYGSEGAFDENGGWGPPPMTMPLAVVKKNL